MSEASADKLCEEQVLLRNMLAGGLCAGLVTTIGNPLDALRVRWQVHTPRRGQTIWGFGRQILRTEGLIRGLWRPGVGANATAIGISSAIGYGFYPIVRDKIDRNLGKGKDGNNEKHAWVMLVSGYVVGAFSYWAVTPLFQMKTRLQAQLQRGRVQYKNASHGLLHIYRHEGAMQLYRGAVPLLIRGSCLRGGAFFGYDTTKTYSKKYGIVEDGPVLHLLASFNSSFLATLFCAPADYVMSRWTAAPILGESYRSLWHLVVHIAKQGGPLVSFSLVHNKRDLHAVSAFAGLLHGVDI